MPLLRAQDMKQIRFEFRVFFLLESFPNHYKRFHSAVIFTQIWRENKGIHSFPS